MVSPQKYAFATFSSIAIFFICSICLACVKKDVAAIAPAADTTATIVGATPGTGSAKTMLALGDSYTIGQNVTEAERFPNQTIASLKAKNANMAYPSKIVATTGWTTRNLIDGIKASNITTTFDVVSLLIGVNNQYQHLDTNTYKTEFPQLLATAIAFANGKKSHVFVVSIPDYGVTPFGGGNVAISADVAHYNAMCKTMAEQMDITFVDITPTSKLGATDPSLTASDGLHPSGKQYGLWAALLLPKIMEAIK